MGGTSSTVTKSQGADEASSTTELGAWDGDATQREQRRGRHDEPRCGQFLLVLDDPIVGDTERELCSQIALCAHRVRRHPGEGERQGAPLLGGISNGAGFMS